ncbi:universal stress protein [Sporichthya polymorpha]|uniref:universal stress protein n=1 Tax=Sporichthya polymorpha TaxID=35751 RepID=UPI00037E88CE|nr:universal stress protein [Sporichthya polymorpha]
MRTRKSHRESRGRIVVGTDGSHASVAAVRWALDAAQQTDSWLDVVLVRSPAIDFGWLGTPPIHGWAQESGLAGHLLLARLLDTVTEPVPEIVRTFVIEGDPAECLIAHAHGADVLVLADRGTGGFLGLRLGSVASACSVGASCPVLIVPSGRRTDLDPAPRTTTGALS